MSTKPFKDDKNFKAPTSEINAFAGSWCGCKDKGNGKFVPQPYSQETMIADFNSGRFRDPISVQKYSAHANSATTLFIKASVRTRWMPAMIDIDVHGSGSFAGAQRFAKYLEEFFPGLYTEPSTSGTGVHGYVLLQGEGLNQDQRAELFNRFSKAISAIAQSWMQSNPGCISGAEVTGRPDIYLFDREGRLASILGGTWMKAPRGLFADFKSHGGISKLHRVSLDKVNQLSQDHVTNPQAKPAKSLEKVKNNSSFGDIIGDDFDLTPYREVASQTFQGRIPYGKRGKTSVEDSAIFIASIHLCSMHPNREGTIGYSRIKAIWDLMVEKGLTHRKWASDKMKPLRDFWEGISCIEKQIDFCPKHLSADEKGHSLIMSTTAQFSELLGQRLGAPSEHRSGLDGFKSDLDMNLEETIQDQAGEEKTEEGQETEKKNPLTNLRDLIRDGWHYMRIVCQKTGESLCAIHAPPWARTRRNRYTGQMRRMAA